MNKNRNVFIVALILLMFPLLPAPKEKPAIPAAIKAVAPNLYLVQGLDGGNVAFLVTTKGVLVVDSGTSPDDGARIVAAIRKVTREPIRFLVLTHYHGDHTLGLQSFPESALVVGHSNVAKNIRRFNQERFRKLTETDGPEMISELKLKVETLKKENHPDLNKTETQLQEMENDLAQARTITFRIPDITFEKGMLIRLGDEIIHLIYPGPAHTNCNLLVIFPKQKVLHTGDMFFHQSLPYIDQGAESDTANWIENLQKALSWNIETVIPGHGPLTEKQSLNQQIGYLAFLRLAVATEMKKGMGLESLKTAITLPEEFKKWEYQEVFTSNIAAVHAELNRAAATVVEQAKPTTSAEHGRGQ